jgi:HK97 family phage major capsid protein
MDERITTTKLHEDLLAQAEKRDTPELNDVEQEQITGYRHRQEELDKEILELNEALKREMTSADVSREVRSHLSGNAPGVSTENGETRYRSFAVFARDQIVAKYPQVAAAAGGDKEREAARERLMRAPQHTTTSDIGGLLPPQHLAQIMDVINKSRPVISASRHVDLERGTLTYPDITQKPQVLLQSSEKTEGGTADMQIALRTATASTYIGGGNLSWQAINWSSPEALGLWFDLASEQYARVTETAACAVLIAAGTASGTLVASVAGTSTFPQWLTAIAAGMAAVYNDSNGAIADTLYLSPDYFFALTAKTSAESASFITQGNLDPVGALSGRIGALRVIASPGMGTANAVVGDSSAFFVAENPGAPVELRAVEPAIGGMEVGVIGAMAAVAFDVQRFIKIG